MKILVAPNALKGSLSAIRAAEVMAGALPKGWESVMCPIADGGDGTLDCLITASGGRYCTDVVTGPLAHMKVEARWGVLGDGLTAVIEMAEASGLRLLQPEQYSVAHATTFGVGEIMLKALDAGFRKIVVGLGGSATNDGGFGCAERLGVQFYDSHGVNLPPGGVHLKTLSRIDVGRLDARILACDIVCLSDVNCPLTGPNGTSKVYARQKGATNEEIERLELALRHYAEILSQELRPDIDAVPGGGAAGGLAAGLIAFCHARPVSGSEYILDAIGFDNLLAHCDAVVTAEGRVDHQTAQGKGIAGIARRANRLQKPVYVFAGRIQGDNDLLAHELGVRSIRQISPDTIDDKEAIQRVQELLAASVESAAATW